VERPVPLFWRTHIAPTKSHAAMRIGDWKIVADEKLEEFQLYEIKKDWKEKNDLAKEHPDKLAELKAKFLEVWEGVEKEGPSEWWKRQADQERRNQGRKKKSGKLAEGKDESGDFGLVRGGKVTTSKFGYLLDTVGSEGFALQKLATPLQEKATFKVKYRSAARGVTRNACFCFGPNPTNNDLYKAGTLIGMGKHGIFEGGWGNVAGGISKKADFKSGDSFEALITIDLEHGEAVMDVGGTKVVQRLPASLEQVSYIGIYAKDTRSEFSKIERVK